MPTRLSNLDKLRLIPIFALRAFVVSKSDLDELSKSAIHKMPSVQLFDLVDKNTSVDEHDIDALYEEYRYGRRLSFQLFLLFGTFPTEEIFNTLQGDLQRFLDSSENLSIKDPSVKQITICSQEQFGDIHEIQFKYLFALRFLDEDENPSVAYETRYGFFWIDLGRKYVVLLHRDDKITDKIINALTKLLKGIPKAAKLPKDLIDRQFLMDNARRLAHLDTETGVRQAISGSTDALDQYRKEISERDVSCVRESAFYDEDISDSIKSGLGVNARKGKIYLTMTLTASVLRAWALRRFPELVDDLHQAASREPNTAVIHSRTIGKLKLTGQAKTMLLELMEAILYARNEQEHEIAFSRTSREILNALDKKFVSLVVTHSCTQCLNSESRCPQCQGLKLSLVNGEIFCEACRTKLSENGSVTLQCEEGHDATDSVESCLMIKPTAHLNNQLRGFLVEYGQTWAVGTDNISIRNGIITLTFAVETITTYLERGAVLVDIQGDATDVRVTGTINN